MDIIAKNEQFRQIKLSLQRENSHLIIGVDSSKSFSTACFYNRGKGILLKKYHCQHSLPGFQQFLEKIESLKKKHNLNNVIIGVEPTGNYHKVLVEFLKDKGYLVVYVSSVTAKNNRKTLDNGRWGKNDPKDAYNIADLMAQGKILFYRDQDSEMCNMRKYLYLRQSLMKLKTVLKNRIRSNIWDCHFPELNTIFKNADDKDALCLLSEYPSAQQVKVMDFNSFLNLFTPVKNPKSKRFLRLTNIWRAAQTSIGYPAVSATCWEAQLLTRDIKRIINDLDQIDRKLTDFCKPNDVYRTLLTIPGFGLFTFSVFKAVVGDIKDFSHANQILKLAGLDLETMSSGQFRGQEKISKKGNALLRYALSQAVNVALAKNKDIKEIFQHKLKSLGNTKKAKAKLKIKFTAKFIRIAFVLLKNNVNFNINRFKVLVEDPVLTT